METKKIVCPFSKTEVELKAWITGKESNKIRKGILDINMEMKGGVPEDKKINLGEMIEKTDEIKINNIVVSVGGETKNVYAKICDLRKADYDFVLAEVEKIYKDEDFLTSAAMPDAGLDAAN